MRQPHKRLCGQMHDDIGPGLAHGRSQSGRIADIGFMVNVHEIAKPGDVEERGSRRRGERIAGHLRPETIEQQEQP